MLRRCFLPLAGALVFLGVVAGCGSDGSSGGGTRLGDITTSATDAERATFERGRLVALRRFSAAEGHGPPFNADSCVACHERPVLGGSAARYRDFVLVGRNSPAGFFTTGVNGVQPHFTRDAETRVATDPLTDVVAARNPVPFFGVGLLAELTDAEILSREDPGDADGDGISGRANRDVFRVGRFGRKAQTSSLEAFVRGPLFNHLGITTDPLPAARRRALPGPDIEREARSGAFALRRWLTPPAWAQAAADEQPTVDDDGVPDPELAEQDLFDLVSFVMLLAAPTAEAPTPATAAGRERFAAIGCADCHVPALAGPRGPVEAFSDLLLHDMGPELADGVVMGRASGSEFRTQPLWGIVAVGPYLHDGRAHTLDEAIRLHGGEGAASRDRYIALVGPERDEVIAFLASLGGRTQRSDGLLPPDATVPDAGAPGGPIAPLDADAQARFTRGRAAFDRDFGVSEGLGRFFNGDSCRACHFDPVIGGAGPIDVNVMRHGGLDETDAFVTPAGGTVLHRHAVAADERAGDARVTGSTVFEMRQPPALFGLGLVARIPDATILANEDPNDVDGDGISGRAHRLADGRLGRFGWQATVPTLRDFARDASSTELGLTVPDDGSAFGAPADGDDAVDPEATRDLVDDLTFFMEQIAPLRPVADDPAGARLFEASGCVACHVPVLQSADGTAVALYSDLLLHDVRAAGASGIADGAAGMRELRTPPLWGLGRTAPYMHDGRSATIREAILRHESEAAHARARFVALDVASQARLLAFLESL